MLVHPSRFVALCFALAAMLGLSLTFAWADASPHQVQQGEKNQDDKAKHTHKGHSHQHGDHQHGDHQHGEHDHQHSHSAEFISQDAQFPPAIVLPEIDGPKPWTDKPHLNDPKRFQIAIMTDRTGGHRPGIWQDAVSKLNLLRPEFVMSVGDLIEGYSENRQRVEAEWQEFLGFMEDMEMKFFFVAGNHDVTNHVMHEIWREHFGPAWYSFDYKDVHFVCLCSEDPQTRIGDDQLAWLKADLDEHADARWTLVFLHKPLWVDMDRNLAAGNPDTTNWAQVEEMLADRPHTVFAGHRHHYVQHDRNGQKYYQLATTGGGSGLRGVPYGEFDHVTWLTMEKDGPRVANLLLSGILPGDVVTTESNSRFRRFLSQSRIEIAPILVDDEAGLSRGEIHIRFTNGFDTPIQLSGDIAGLPLRGITVDPMQLGLTAQPGETAEFSVGIEFVEPVSFSHFAGTVFRAKLRSQEERPLNAELVLPVVIDRKYPVPLRAASVQMDGKLEEWDALPYSTGEQPLVTGSAQDWQGTEDASAKFQVAANEEFVYIAAQITDEMVLGNDALEVRIDGRPLRQRLANSRYDSARLRFTVPVSGNFQAVRNDNRNLRGAQAELAQTDAGYNVELAIPAAVLNEVYGDTWRDFQMSLIVLDVDAAGEKSANIIWRGTRDYGSRSTNFGQFVREE